MITRTRYNNNHKAAGPTGQELLLPHFGMETLHHVHAADVAQAFAKALDSRGKTVGESFHVVSPKAITLRGYAEKVASWFGREANLRFMPWDQWKSNVSEDEALATYDHLAHSPNCRIEKARNVLGYEPRYSSMGAVCESLDWLIQHGVLKLRKPGA